VQRCKNKDTKNNINTTINMKVVKEEEIEQEVNVDKISDIKNINVNVDDSDDSEISEISDIENIEIQDDINMDTIQLDNTTNGNKTIETIEKGVLNGNTDDNTDGNTDTTVTKKDGDWIMLN
jgi:hypothetical protein